LELALKQKGVDLQKLNVVDPSEDDQVANNPKGIKNELQARETELEAAKRKLSQTTQFVSDLKTGMMSLFLKAGIEDVNPSNFATKSREVIEKIVSNLKIARAHLSAKQFQHLIDGELNVRDFLAKFDVEKKDTSGDVASKMRTEESIINKNSQATEN
jgi:hypothetical protein